MLIWIKIVFYVVRHFCTRKEYISKEYNLFHEPERCKHVWTNILMKSLRIYKKMNDLLL